MSQLQSQWPYGAQALRYDPETRTLWQRQLPGRVLTWEKLLAADWRAVIDRMADCVAGLHQSAIDCPQSFGVVEIRQQLAEAVQLAQRLDDAVAARMRALVQRLVSHIDRMGPPTVAAAPLHRDLKLINFLLDERGASVWLIDLDDVALGDPSIDLGSLVGNLYLNSLRRDAAPETTERVVAHLITAYAQRAAVSRRHLYWHIAAAMIYEVLRRSIRQRNAERLRRISAYLQISERYCRLATAVDPAHQRAMSP